MTAKFASVFFLLAARAPALLHAEPPHAVDERLMVELVAQEPEIRTPTAIQVDPQGRIWVLENNTHFRPKNYDAPPTDRVLIFDDFAPGGRARKTTVFADGFTNGMGLRLLPDGGALISTRAEIFRLRDTDGDGRADEHTTLLKLETTDDYPHNGLSSIALDGAGHLFVGLGENHGAPWTLSGTDGVVLRGSDEGGIFRCDLEGRGLERWAIGFWNPFGLAFDARGRIFALDNDPSGGSLCRLLNVVRGGDYGYRYRYGRTIEHVFLSWFGQLPGTLPPICLTGEAPTGLLECRSVKFPAELRGDLLGCTWSEHGVQRFRLVTKGLGFTSQPQWFLRGGDDFRPSGIAEAPDGSLVVSDWVDGAYEVHGKGRIWRVRARDAASTADAAKPAKPDAPVMTAESIANEVAALDRTRDLVLERLDSADPFVVHAAIDALVRGGKAESLRSSADDPRPRVRVGILLALRRSGAPESRELLPRWLADADGMVRRAALQWIAEERLAEFRPQLDAALAGQPSRDTFLAWIAAVQFVESGKPDPKATVVQTTQIALDAARPSELRALALRLLPVGDSTLPLEKLRELLGEKDAGVRTAAAIILAARADDAAQAELRRIATDEQAAGAVRAEALAGLARSAAKPETRAVLRKVIENGAFELAREALRSLRGQCTPEEFQLARKRASAADAESRELSDQLLIEQRSSPALRALPGDEAAGHAPPLPGQAWPAVLEGKGDPAAGRRLFFHPNGPRCFMCHAIEGRGTAVGPDLTQVGRFTAAQLLEAIREPSKEIAPAYTQWLVTLKNGSIAAGIDLFEDDKSGIKLIDATGVKTRYKVEDIAAREPMPVSLMPPGLENMMTEQEMRDLLAFLREPRE